jgi:hypothetical protein
MMRTMTRSSSVLGLVVGLLVCVAGCEPRIAAQTAAGEESLIAHYATFGLLLPDPDELRQSKIKPETLQRLARLSTDDLLDRGYRPTASDRADVFVAIRPGVKSFRELHAHAPLGGADNLPAGRGYDEGILTVSFIDARLKRSVLERKAEIRLGDGVSEEQLEEVVARLFESIPRAVPTPEGAAATSAPAAVQPAPGQAP